MTYYRRLPIIIMTVLTLLQTAEIFSQDIKHNSIKLNIFSPIVYWQGSKYKHDKFDYLGFGVFISPEYKLTLNKFYCQFDFMINYFPFTGPDELTETGPDFDIDYGFKSKMRRNDLGLQIGYNIMDFISFSLVSKYFYMNIKGDIEPKTISQAPFSYTEKGILFGPGINIHFPHNNSGSFITISASYLIGQLDYSYLSHIITYIRRSYENKINTQLLLINTGYSFYLDTDLLLGLSLESNYFFKIKHTEYDRYPEDLWFVGLNTSLSYNF